MFCIVSSVYRSAALQSVMEDLMLLIETVNGKGASIEPCGAPLIFVKKAE